MRTFLMTIALIAFLPSCGPAYALQGSDTMKAWRDASSQERRDLLEQLLGKSFSGGSESAKTLNCLNEASMIQGHVDLEIREVARACLDGQHAGQPV